MLQLSILCVRFQKKLTGKTATILIDDLSKGETTYSQIATVLTLGELVYSGFVKKYTAHLQLDIEGFRGSAIINTQPLILRKLLAVPEFETDMRDKVIRYYHLRRPVKITLKPPSNGLDYNYNYHTVETPKEILASKLYDEGITFFRLEFSRARAYEHYNALIKASANINKRHKVTEADLWLVNQIAKTFVIETQLFEKDDLEGERRLDPNIIPILSVLATFKKYPFTELAADFQVKETRLYQILAKLGEYVAVVKNGDENVVVPTSIGRNLLKLLGEWEDE